MKKILVIMLIFSQLNLFAKKPEGTVTYFSYSYSQEDELHGSQRTYEASNFGGASKIRIVTGKTEREFERKANPMDFITGTVEKYRLYRIPKVAGAGVHLTIRYSDGKTYNFSGEKFPACAEEGIKAIVNYLEGEALELSSREPKSFSLREGGGMMMNSGSTYELMYNDGVLEKTVRHSGEAYEKTSFCKTADAFDGIQKIVEQYKVWTWGGSYRLDVMVTDGMSWNCNIIYDNGEWISANGYMYAPENFREAQRAFANYIDNLK